MEKSVFDNEAVSAGGLSKDQVPAKAGLYCIQLENGADDFQPPFDEIFRQRRDSLLYIGKAKGRGGLRRRLFDNELRNRGAGTFFRSLGVVLGHCEQVKPLRLGRNFSFENASEIADWIRANLWVSWRVFQVEEIDAIEQELIRRRSPMLNIMHNPQATEALRHGRRDCVRRARARYQEP